MRKFNVGEAWEGQIFSQMVMVFLADFQQKIAIESHVKIVVKNKPKPVYSNPAIRTVPNPFMKL